MKKNLLGAICIFTLTIFAINTQAQGFSLVKDINNSRDGNPSSSFYDLYLSFTPYFFPVSPVSKPFTIFKGAAYFAADDGVHGTEIWRTDNTVAGTHMLKDINPGSASSDIEDITVAGNKLFFTANRVVYVSDGTEAGTVPVPGISYTGDVTTCLTAVGSDLYFLTNVSRLWKTDGTAQGTLLVVDFRVAYNYQRDFLGQLTSAGGTLYFTTGSDNINGSELWKSDGTAGGTALVKDIYPGTQGALPLNLTSVGGKLYFTADDGSGRTLWVSDGTDAGTKKLVNKAGVTFPLNSIYNSTDGFAFPVIGKVLYFKAYNSSTGTELYKYDINNAVAGIKLVKDIVTGSDSSEPANFTAVDSLLYFSVSAAGNQVLYKTDGTKQGTALVKNLGPGQPGLLSWFTAANGKLLFNFYTAASGYELWKSDGTSSGTKMVKDIYPGSFSSNPHCITYFANGVSLVSATDGVKGIELWITDGSTTGTKLLKNINDITTAGSNPFLYNNTGVLNSKLFFTASDALHSNVLYVSDGTDAGTQMLDLNNGNSPAAAGFTTFKNRMYFSATASGNSSLFKSDGTAGSTKLLFNAATAGLSIWSLIAAQDYLYIFYRDYSNNTTQLWTSDGTASGFRLVQVIPSLGTNNGVAVGNTIYFTGFDSTHGSELWKADNTANSASLVKDIVPGADGSNISVFTVYNNKVYFVAWDASNAAYYVYTSDGTGAGTKKLSGNPASPTSMAVANNKLFFVGHDASLGEVLFVSSGTAASTKEIYDRNTNSPVQYPSRLSVLNDKVFCAGFNPTYGPEVFKTDGTKSGTSVLKDIDPGISGAFPGQLSVAGANLYFMGSGSHYNELWVTDGTSKGTRQVTDAGLSGVTVNAIVGSDNLLFIDGYTYAYGGELYAGNVQGIQPANAMAGKQAGIMQALAVNILGNPVRDKINLTISSPKSQPVSILLSDASGKVLMNKKESVAAGVSAFSYSAGNLPAGVYNLKVTALDGSSATVKIMK